MSIIDRTAAPIGPTSSVTYPHPTLPRLTGEGGGCTASGTDATMNAITASPARIGDSRLAERLRRETEGEVLWTPGDRGRYATDASIYQVEPVGVLVPRSIAD